MILQNDQCCSFITFPFPIVIYKAKESAEDEQVQDAAYKDVSGNDSYKKEAIVVENYNKQETDADDGYKAAVKEASYEDHGKGERIMKEIDDTRNQVRS